jgi:3-polyprenyl-4-hydroxybenzoate decarboxylase
MLGRELSNVRTNRNQCCVDYPIYHFVYMGYYPTCDYWTRFPKKDPIARRVRKAVMVWPSRARWRSSAWRLAALSSITRREGSFSVHSAFSPWAAKLRWARNRRSSACCASPASWYASPARRKVSAMSR